ncbi:hypothetical protein BD289DRAFT_199266 [Coniella lustricola]|uniref:Uncharacterized protein n=1 Tax=Coniella lustricola TaxID=2025994 RepID=A0A2T3ACP5_9PEZI|nr:hypothetical protein BD289DRAFT_199266 [Coniella lustricola]
MRKTKTVLLWSNLGARNIAVLVSSVHIRKPWDRLIERCSMLDARCCIQAASCQDCTLPGPFAVSPSLARSPWHHGPMLLELPSLWRLIIFGSFLGVLLMSFGHRASDAHRTTQLAWPTCEHAQAIQPELLHAQCPVSNQRSIALPEIQCGESDHRMPWALSTVMTFSTRVNMP